MAVSLTPSMVLIRAVEEGERRLGQSLMGLVSTGFIAGVTIIFGMVALGTVEGLLEEEPRGLRTIAGAFAFAPGVVFLVAGRAELFSENFFDPVAAIVERRRPGMTFNLMRLWAVTFVLNLVGGALFASILSVEGALPEATARALSLMAEEIGGRDTYAFFVTAIAGGALVTLLSYMLQAIDSIGGQIFVAYMVGFLLALGPFDHVVVTLLHVFFGILFGADVGTGHFLWSLVVVTVGNLAGGLGLVTLTHIAQARS